MSKSKVDAFNHMQWSPKKIALIKSNPISVLLLKPPDILHYKLEPKLIIYLTATH